MAVAQQHLRPAVMGIVMSPMLLWMLHGILIENDAAGWAIAVFVLAHVAVIGVVVIGGMLVGRRSPRLRAVANRLHRPSMAHVAVMLGTATATAAIMHFAIHGGI